MTTPFSVNIKVDVPSWIAEEETEAFIASVCPKYGSDLANAVDLVAVIEKPITLLPGDKGVLVSTGISIEMSAYSAALVLPRSGLGHKHGVELANTIGLIDFDYRGIIMCSLRVKPGYPAFTINPGDRIAQMMFVPTFRANLNIVSEFSEQTSRGAGGFGSTGV